MCTVLPRLPSQSVLVALKLKLKLSYKGHSMYDYVTPEKVDADVDAYVVEVNEEWLVNAQVDGMPV